MVEINITPPQKKVINIYYKQYLICFQAVDQILTNQSPCHSCEMMNYDC